MLLDAALTHHRAPCTAVCMTDFLGGNAPNAFATSVLGFWSKRRGACKKSAQSAHGRWHHLPRCRFGQLVASSRSSVTAISLLLGLRAE
jgi:hypothetical protein